MTNKVISIENLSKQYHLGTIGTGTFYNDLKVWWAKQRGKPNPLAKVDDVDFGNRDGETIWALNNVSLEVNQGEALGIIGRNGAGKSTFLKILSRVTAPTSGKIKVKGRIASLLEVGTGFHPELTGRENIYLNGAILGMNREEVNQKLDEIIDFSGVEKFIDTPVKRYSSGMYVRLAFAVAAHLEPEILVVDEVLAVGDAEFQKKCLGKMNDIAGEGRTVLFVSHNMASIAQLCSRCILMKQGMLEQDGNTDHVINQYFSDSFPSQTLSRDLAAIPRAKNAGTKLKITNVIIIPENGQAVNFRKSFDIRLSIEVLEDLSDVEIGVGFNNTKGVRLLTITSENKTIENLKKGMKMNATLRVKNNILPPSNYILSVGASSGGDFSIDSVPEALSFEVVAQSESTIHQLRSDLGVRLLENWDINISQV
jgi:lipopolysaccharide transport system ATP-binding protein